MALEEVDRGHPRGLLALIKLELCTRLAKRISLPALLLKSKCPGHKAAAQRHLLRRVSEPVGTLPPSEQTVSGGELRRRQLASARRTRTAPLP
mmetsp:Transcript_93139/g.272573  ORF Transcript_93139/g.272573 Transcript_93139/m.272573 type:complete len:93 (+) Transcript_93139:454-732(+)